VTGTGLERQRLGHGGRAQEAHRLHGEVGRAIAASLRDPTQEVSTGAAHLNLALLCRVSSVAAPALRAARPLWRQAE